LNFYTMQELADILRISLPTVKRMQKAGKIKLIRVGRQVRIPGEEVERIKREGI